MFVLTCVDIKHTLHAPTPHSLYKKDSTLPWMLPTLCKDMYILTSKSQARVRMNIKVHATQRACDLPCEPCIKDAHPSIQYWLSGLCSKWDAFRLTLVSAQEHKFFQPRIQTCVFTQSSSVTTNTVSFLYAETRLNTQTHCILSICHQDGNHLGIGDFDHSCRDPWWFCGMPPTHT